MPRDSPNDDDFDNTHRALVQAFLSHRILTQQDLKLILTAIISAHTNGGESGIEDISDSFVNGYVAIINEELSKYDMEVRKTPDQKDRSVFWYALVNTTSDALTQIATLHTADEIAFFKRVLDAMFETNNTLAAEVLAVKSTDALALHKNPRVAGAAATQAGDGEASQQTQTSGAGLTMQGAETALEDFVSEGWLLKSKTGYYSLPPRALMELAAYLTETYNNPDNNSTPSDSDSSSSPSSTLKVKSCEACKLLLTVGQRCSSLHCPIRMHTPCAETYFRVHRNEKKCPKCKSTWTGNDVVGEGAAGKLRRRGGNSGRRSSAGGQGRAARGAANNTANNANAAGRRKQRRRSGDSDDEEEDERMGGIEEEEGEEVDDDDDE